MKRRDLLLWGSMAPLFVPARVVQAQVSASTQSIHWKLASSFPPVLDTIHGGGERFAATVGRLSGGRFTIDLLPTGKPIAPFGVFDAVSTGEVQMGHTAGYYYTAKDKALAFDTGIPFGLSARQQNAWLNEGGGLPLLRTLFAKHNIVNFAAGNTGTQMGGWFNRRIASSADLKGLRMRTAGLAGLIMKELGAVPVPMPGSEIVAAMRDGKIDAAEWVGPYDDEKLGLPKVAKYYYFPGWWEPSTTLSVYVNKTAYDSLSPENRSIIEIAAAETNAWMMSAYDARNAEAYRRLITGGQFVGTLPEGHLSAAYDAANKLYKAECTANAEFKKLHDSWSRFRLDLVRWHNTAEASMQSILAKRLTR